MPRTQRTVDRPIIIKAERIAALILSGFDHHFKLFTQANEDIIRLFTEQNWQVAFLKTTERMRFFDQRSQEIVVKIKQQHRIQALDSELWLEVKYRYIDLLYGHLQPELAETFYNSVFCRFFSSHYFNNDYIFVQPVMATDFLDLVSQQLSYCEIRLGINCRQALRTLTQKINLPSDIHADLKPLLQAIRKQKVLSVFHQAKRNSALYLQVLSNPMYRNKACYLIGKLVMEDIQQPLVLAMRYNDRHKLYIDALLTDAQHIANIFSTARSSFVLQTRVPAETVHFLESVVPGRDRHELYSGIGFHKQAKTEFYRELMRHIKHSDSQFDFASGVKGMVMCVFTLDSFPYVFKVIRDKIERPKNTNRDKVKACYRLVKESDRIGRMVDTLEFSNMTFPLSKFTVPLIEELQQTCPSMIKLYPEDDQIVIAHAYVERRLIPLNIYIEEVDDKQRSAAMDEYGNALRQLAAANIFPGDLFMKNFGVTRHNKVLFYDFDEIDCVSECNFRDIPEAMYPEQELQDEPWYSVNEQDIFPEEFAFFLFNNDQDLADFKKHHAALLTAKFWQQQKLEQSQQASLRNVYIYPQSVRLNYSGNE